MKNIKEFLSKYKNNLFFGIILIITVLYIALNSTSSLKNLYTDEEIYSFSTTSKPIVNSNFDNGFFLTTSADTKFIDAEGKEKMVHSALISDPMTSYAGDYLAVWNKKTNGNVFVLSKKNGLEYTVENSDTILDVDVNKNGYLAILVKDVSDSGYILNMYNNKGQSIVSRICDTEDNFPISVSLLDDNRIVALCEIDTNSLTPKSYISFSYLNEEDNETGDVIFTGLTFENEIIAKIDFRKNYLIAYAKDKIHILSITNDKVKETGTISVNNEINFAQIVDDKYIALSVGTPINSNAIEANTVLFYSFDGKLISQTQMDSTITNMTAGDNSVIIVSGRKISEISVDGKEVFSYTHSRDVVNSYYIGNKYPAIVVENNAVFPIKKGN